MPNPTDDVLIIGQLKDEKLRDAIKDLVDFVDTQSGAMANNFNDSLSKMQEAMKKFAVNQKASVSLMKEAMQQYGLMFDDVWKQTFPDPQQQQQPRQPKQYAPNTIGALEQELSLKEKIRKEDELDSDALRQHNKEIEETKNKLATQKGLNTTAASIKKVKDELKEAYSMPSNSLEQAEKRLKKLNNIAASYRGAGVLDKAQWNRLTDQIDKTTQKIERLKLASLSMKDIKAMPEKSVADIAQKLQAIRNVQIDPKNTAQVKKLGDEYQRLTRLQNELLGKGIQLTKSNNYLAQSFGYIRNRLVYAMTLGAATSFVKNVYEIRSQYELLERSLGVLLGSFERGTQIFNELNTMALKSPFTLMELGTAAKQLTAYNFKAEEVVNTTKRLADLSAALGVPMERLTYNLGQIRAQTVLTARDARDFANAGLPIVKSLSEYFSELEGRVVSTGDVFERMSKKQVTYNDVMAVLNQMTDEGGKFFDFQAKQAETLRVQLANLTLAWNNMLNDIGEANQGVLTAPITALKALFANWEEISHVITEVIVAMGAYKGMQIVVNKLVGESATVMQRSILVDKEKKAAELQREATTRKLTKTEEKAILNKKQIVAADYKAILSTRNLSKTQALLLAAYNKNNAELMKALVQMKLLKKAEIENITIGKAWKVVLAQIGVSLKSLGATIAIFAKQAAVMLAIGAIVEAVYTWSEIADKINDINKGITDSAKESAESISKFLESYKETIKKANELKSFMTQQGTPTFVNPETGRMGYKNSMGEDETQKAWEAIREEITMSSAASDVFLRKLMSISDMNERIREGFRLLEQIHDVNGALESLDDTAIKITGDWSKWWNLWIGSDGLIDNLKDYTNYLTKMEEKWGSINALIEADKQGVEGAGGDYHDANAKLITFMNDLRTTTESMHNAFTSVGLTSAEEMREAFDRSNQQILQDGNLSSKEQLHYKIQAEKDFVDYKMNLFKESAEVERSLGREDRAKMVEEEAQAWKAAFGEGQAISQEFFNWLKGQHASEINKLFGNMSKREIEQINWSEPKWQKWATENAEAFSKQYGVAFSRLQSLVNDANRWKIFLKLTITTDEKGVYDTLKDADAAANAAWTKIERLKQRQSELNKIAEKKQTDAQKDEAKKIIKELDEAQKDYEDALAKGGHSSKATKQNTKDQKTAEQELAEALKQELQVIKDMQSNYDKLTKAGVDSMTALDASTQGYEATLERVNMVLSKYGISKFNAKDFVGKDVNDLLAKLEKQRSQLIASGKTKTSAIEALDIKIKEVKVEATTYNMKKVTDGLTNELSKVKDEYELAVELDANPELGGIFADMMGLSAEQLNQLPKDFNAVVSKLQTIIDKKVKNFDLSKNLNKKNLEDWFVKNKIEKGSELEKELTSYVDYANDVRQKETKKQIEDWDKLLEKYAEYEYKRKQITEQYERELATARKKGANADIISAITNRRDREYAQLDFNEFMKTPEWITATGDLANMSHKAIGTLINDLEAYKAKARNLDPKQIKQLNSALSKLYKEQRKNNPFKAISNMLDEAKNRMATFDEEIKNTQEDIDKLTREKNDLDFYGITDDETNSKLEKAIKRLAKLKETQKEVGQVDATDWVASINETISAVQQAISVFDDLAKTIGDVSGDSDVQKTFSVLEKAGSFAATGALLGGSWGAVIGGVIGAATSIISLIAGAGNEKINRQIEESERNVKRLEYTYLSLQRAIDKAYGSSINGAKQAMAAAKKLELVELERQLQLEKSRDAKDRDQDRIIDLQKQIRELKYEIQDMYTEVVNDLLGQDVGSFAETLVSTMIDAFRTGEDYMLEFEKSFDKLIDNMILKSIMSRVVSSTLDALWDDLENRIKARSEKEADNYADAAKEYDRIVNMSDNELMYEIARKQGHSIWSITQEEIDAYREAAKQRMDASKAYLDAASQIGDSDISWLMAQVAEIAPQLSSQLYDAISKYYTFGQDTEKNLSALQQGIQGVTEDTAGSIEAYMNIVSQRVFEQNEYLRQIVEFLNIDADPMDDIKVASLSQILLQLRDSYQVQLAIQSRLDNWSNANGMAVRVEMV